MELSWIKSFVSIAHTRSFSASARECHVTQPAFSRRIRAIENWAGTPLIDRSTYPTRLTPEGKCFLKVAVDVESQLATLKTELYNRRSRTEATVRLVAQHSLALGVLPDTLKRCEAEVGNVFFNVVADNFHNCVELLQADNADILLSFSLPGAMASLDNERFQCAVIGWDTLMPVAKPGNDGRPCFTLSDAPEGAIPWLSYGTDAMLNHGISRLLDHKDVRCVLEPVLENPISEVLRRFTLAGMGLAWLPRSLIEADLRENRLTLAESDAWQIPLEIHAYRFPGEVRPVVEQVWTQISTNFGTDYALKA